MYPQEIIVHLLVARVDSCLLYRQHATCGRSQEEDEECSRPSMWPTISGSLRENLEDSTKTIAHGFHMLHHQETCLIN